MGLGPEEPRARRERDVASLLSQISYLEEEIGLLRRKVADSPRQVRLLEELIAEAEGRAAFLSERNDKLAGTLREAREQLVTLKLDSNLSRPVKVKLEGGRRTEAAYVPPVVPLNRQWGLGGERPSRLIMVQNLNCVQRIII